MAKRIEPIENFGPSKKRKCDVSESRERAATATSNILEFWASDDDDDVLLATQKAEEKQREIDEMIYIEREFAFSEFVPQANGSTRTQQVYADDMLNLPSNLNVEEVFGTDETFVFLPDAKRDKKPNNEDIKTVTGKENDLSSIQATAARRQLAHELQVKFLVDRIDEITKKNEKLSKELRDIKNLGSFKNGEIGLLRNDLREARKLLQASKMDKLTKVAADEKDCNEKDVSDKFKQAMAKKDQLNFTNVELSQRKIRNATNNKRNILKESNLLTVPNDDKRRKFHRMAYLCIKKTFPKPSTIKHVVEYPYDANGQKNQRSFVEVEFEHLLLNYSQLLSESSAADTIIDCIHMSVERVCNEFLSYTYSLELPQNYMMYPYNHFNLHSDQSPSMRLSLVQPGALYSTEQAIVLRRYIGTLALICQSESIIAQTLLCNKFGNDWVPQIITEAITNIGYSTELSAHFGVLEATAELLKSLIKHVNLEKTINGSQLGFLCELLKQLVFTRPSPWVFRELSACMLLCANNSQLIEKLCVNSPSNCFESDRVRSLYRFGPKSCLIQVYAGLLELCFSTNVSLQPTHFKLLLSICENHVRFVYQCFTTPPEFILKMQNLTDEENEDNDELLANVVGLQSDVTTETIQVSALSSNNISQLSSIPVLTQKSDETHCECYVKLCLSVVTIVFQMMYQWIIQDEKSDTLQVGEISQISVQLLTLIFREYFLTCLFRDSEETTKHYLYLLCKWWQTHSRVLNFKDIHLRFLKQLQDLQFMLKPLNQEGNLTNLKDDLAEWTRIVNDADTKMPKFVQTNELVDCETEFSCNKSNFFNGLKKDCL